MPPARLDLADHAVLEFLAAHRFGTAEMRPLPGDAGLRRYARLHGGPRPALLMLAPPIAAAAPGDPAPPEDVRRFAHLSRHLLATGLSAPEILAEDPARGLLLIEDFGEATHADVLDAGADPMPLYVEAAGALAALHAAPPPAGLPRWDAAAMARTTAATLLDWWWPAAFGTGPTPAVRAELDVAMADMLSPFAAVRGFVHRDFFPANLMRLPDRDGPRRTGVLDFQDAALGHPAYDLVSLVEDARRDVAPAAREAAIDEYLVHRPDLDRADLAAAMAAHGAQRHLRVAAQWVRLARRDGKPGYLIHGPRCWALLARALSHAACAPLAHFLNHHVPCDMRRNPTGVPSARVPEGARG